MGADLMHDVGNRNSNMTNNSPADPEPHDEGGNFVDCVREMIELGNQTTALLRSLGYDTTRAASHVRKCVTGVLERFRAKRTKTGEELPLLLRPEDVVHIAPAASKASHPLLQEMLAELLTRAVVPDRSASRIQQDAQTIGALTPEAAAVLCFLVRRWPDGVDLSADELREAFPTKLGLYELRDALDLLVQQRCMSVWDDAFSAGNSIVTEGPDRRSGNIFVRSGDEEFRVTPMGRRIVELYGPGSPEDVANLWKEGDRNGGFRTAAPL